MTSIRGRSVGGRTRSLMRSSISTRRPQHVLLPAGTSVSETGRNSLTLYSSEFNAGGTDDNEQIWHHVRLICRRLPGATKENHIRVHTSSQHTIEVLTLARIYFEHIELLKCIRHKRESLSRRINGAYLSPTLSRRMGEWRHNSRHS
jgi:hypothetical protein